MVLRYLTPKVLYCTLQKRKEKEMKNPLQSGGGKEHEENERQAAYTNRGEKPLWILTTDMG